MNEARKELLERFATLLKNNPNADVQFLWVQAGGKVASQPSVQADVCDSCGAKWIPSMSSCSVCGTRR